ncbi:ABC transporter permease [Arthrobacter sp. DNA4]|uniref:ABC transporter permease subunit n=1 Tax=Micrococcaceae TaxID=1268 RepID=UPI0020CF1EBE|nr:MULTISPECIES: ABC transporter permease subunit [Micrococcaceae]UTT71094.1 ABC transporter permease [Arthrobacter sp. DNA4]WRT15535.1 ABC transporter permease subunit [Pseudarthrobacter sp. LT1]
MLASVLLKTLRDQGRLLVAWAVSLALIVAMYAAVWPSVKSQPSISSFIEQMPEAFRSLFATSSADMSTPTGYIQVELLSFMGPIAVLVYAVSTGAGAIGGEEDRHTMDLLLSNPVGRGRVVVDKFLAMVLGTFLLAAVLGISLVLEGSMVDLVLPADKVAAAMLHLALLGVVFGALALALSAGTGRTGLSRGVPAVLAVLAYIVNALAPLVDVFDRIQKVSPFFQYIAHDPLRNGTAWDSVLVSAATIAVLVALAVAGFRRRDVAG